MMDEEIKGLNEKEKEEEEEEKDEEEEEECRRYDMEAKLEEDYQKHPPDCQKHD